MWHTFPHFYILQFFLYKKVSWMRNLKYHLLFNYWELHSMKRYGLMMICCFTVKIRSQRTKGFGILKICVRFYLNLTLLKFCLKIHVLANQRAFKNPCQPSKDKETFKPPFSTSCQLLPTIRFTMLHIYPPRSTKTAYKRE